MKKILLFVLLILTLSACGGKKSDPNTLHLYNWSEYLPAEVKEKFEAETGIKVVEDFYSSNEEMFAKLKAGGGGGYDIVVPSADYTEVMIKEGMVDKIDKSKISTLNNLDPKFMEKLATIDPNNEHAVPFAIGATGIAVNKEKVKSYPKDFSIYEMIEYKDRMTLLDDMREVMTSALLTLGYKQDTKNEEEIKKAVELINKWKANIVKFDSDSFGKGLASNEFYIVHGYYENIAGEISEEQFEKIDFFIPEKGATAYVDSMVILKDAPNKEAAHKFMEFFHKPENYKLVVDYLKTPSVNIPARDARSTTPVYSEADMEKATFLKDVGEALEIQNKYWEELKLQ